MLKQDQPLRQEIDALKTAEAQRQADAEAARNLAAFQGWQTNWDKKWELPAGTSAGMTEAFSKAAASPADGARLLTLGLLVESGKVPVAMVPEATRAAIIKADQERIRKATDRSPPGLAGTGGSPPTVPGAFKPKPGSTPLQVTEQAEAWLKAHGRQ